MHRNCCSHTGFNGAEDRSPDGHATSIRHSDSGNRFNGAGEHSPNVTRPEGFLGITDVVASMELGTTPRIGRHRQGRQD